jgi:hypothetical protein
MGSLVLRVLGAVGAAILSVTTFGGGVASADGLTGKTYTEAAAAISSWKGTPVVATVSGDQLEQSDCIVTSWHASIFLDSSGDNSRGKNYLLNLNCNNRIASPGNPGNSMMTPDAALAKKELQAARNINKDPSYCDIDAGHHRSCVQICERTGLCTVSSA